MMLHLLLSESEQGGSRANFDAWPVLARRLRIPTTARKYGAVVVMVLLLWNLYKTTQVGNLACHAVAKEYRVQCCPVTTSNYMVFVEWDCDTVLQSIRGLGMLWPDVQETLTRFEKQAHNEHRARGGGSFAD